MSTNSDTDANSSTQLIRGAVHRVSNIKPIAIVNPTDRNGNLCDVDMYRLWPMVPSNMHMLHEWPSWQDTDFMRFITPLDLWNRHYWPTVPSYVKSGDGWRPHRHMPKNAKRRPLKQQPTSNWRNNNTFPDLIDPEMSDDYVLIDDDDSGEDSHSSMY